MSYELLGTALFAELEIPVEVLKNKSIEISGLRLDLKKGSKVALPLRLLMPLIKEGIIKLDEGRLYDFNTLNKIRWREERSEELQRLEKDFYLKSRLVLSLLENRLKEDVENYELLSKIKQIKVLLMDIVKRRGYKISRLAFASPEPSRDLMERMTREERMFYVKLCDLIKSWQESMSIFIERGEVIEH
ncbi:MAG: hypothetical protein DRJ41_00435 [Thermoprotei archaeon]|nr:MAG: hypothetical protein DRJ41_00435 [Thermoprotei archaeon]